MNFTRPHPLDQPEHTGTDNCTCRRCSENREFVKQEYRKQKQEVKADLECDLDVEELLELIKDATQKHPSSTRDNKQTRAGWCRKYQEHQRDRHRDVHKNRHIQRARARSEKGRSNIDPKDPFANDAQSQVPGENGNGE